MKQELSSDKEVNQLFERVSSNMQSIFGYSADEAWILITNYYSLFKTKSYCDSLGIGVQDDDFFFHEAPMGMAMRIHYYLALKADPNPRAFLLWRKDFVSRMKEAQHGGTS